MKNFIMSFLSINPKNLTEEALQYAAALLVKHPEREAEILEDCKAILGW